MSKHNRTSRRRRIALGLGATGGGLLAAAFMPVGIALADTTSDAVAAAGTGVIGTDPGLFPTDLETVPDPFTDFTGLSGNAEGLLDQQINIDNPILAAQIDYDIDNKMPFSFDGLTVPAGYDPDAGGADLGPFTDAFANNSGASAGITQADALSYDYALNQLLTPTQVGQLDALADGTATTVSGTPGEPTTPDPFLDAVQAVYTTPTADQIAQANYADYLLDTQNPTYAGQLDAAVEASVKAGTLSATSTAGGGTGDTDAFSDAFTNAGSSDLLNPGGGFDSTADLSAVANQLDPIVDTLGNPAAAPDLDPAADWVQFFDPTAFTVNPLTGLEVANPNDFLATLAVDYDAFINTIPGLAAPYDAFVDSAIASLTSLGL
jgi:hypothetical protein